MFSIKNTAIIAGFAGAMFATTAAHAVLIDAFNDAQTITQSGVGTSSNSAAGAMILGGSRDIIVEVMSGTGDFTIDIDNTSPGNMSYSSDIGVDGKVTIQWDGADGSSALDTAGLGSVDLTAGGENAIGIRVVASDFAADLMFEVYSNGGADVSTLMTSTPALATNADLIIPFADFIGTADFTDVSAIVMMIDGPVNTDLQIDFVQSTIEVPEPGMAALFGLGLIGLGLARRRKAS